jgi:copper chaperone CopZ
VLDMVTEMRIDGANCPICLNTTLDALRAVPGVQHVSMSSVEGCVAIDHDDVDVATLVDTIRGHLHGIVMYGAEFEMVSIDPVVAELRCGHHPAP